MKKSVILIFTVLTFVFAAINMWSYLFIPNRQITLKINTKEEFDPKLYRLNTISKLVEYTDSLYGKPVVSHSDSLRYASTIAKVVRLRFYHGWAKYGFTDNWVLYSLQFIHPNVLGVISPNFILKYSEALCSQQAMVAMEALKSKGYTFRTVGFFDTTRNMGHFAYEVRTDTSWHFYDVDLEPNKDILDSSSRPSIVKLNSDQGLLNRAYSNQKKLTESSFLSKYYFIGKPNEFQGYKTFWFHRVTFFLSCTLWLFGLLLYVKNRTR